MRSAHRRYAKRDQNEASLIALARQLGASWIPISVKDGPDGVIGWRQQSHLVEIKTAKGQLRPGQVTFAETWQGSPIHVIRTEADLVQLFGLEKTRTAAR